VKKIYLGPPVLGLRSQNVRGGVRRLELATHAGHQTQPGRRGAGRSWSRFQLPVIWTAVGAAAVAAAAAVVVGCRRLLL